MIGPLTEPSLYAPPRATIDQDKTRSWLRRAMPIVLSHKATLLTALILSFVGLVLQVQIPNLLNQAVTNSVMLHKVPLSHYTWIVFGFAIAVGHRRHTYRGFS